MKTKVSWRNKNGQRGENKSVVAVQKVFTPILKAAKKAKYRARNKQATRQRLKIGEEYKT